MQIRVSNNRQENRFEATIEGYLAVIRYRQEGGSLVMTHTEVPKELGGRGVGSQLVRAALDAARDAGQQVDPVCPFIKSYIERHPEYQGLLAD